MTMAHTLIPPAPQPPAPASDTKCDALLRQGRQLLDAGQLAPASAAGWQAAQSAMSAYASPDAADASDISDMMNGKAAFRETAGRLLNHYQVDCNASEWIFSALALADNAACDWLDRDGVSRRLDDVQRLSILVNDIAHPPQTAAALLRQAWQCMDNGYLIPASVQGRAAALLVAKRYAHAIGCDYHGESDFDAVMRLLAAEQNASPEIGGWAHAAACLPQTAAYCARQDDNRYADIVADDLDAVAKLADFVQTKVAAKKRLAI